MPLTGTEAALAGALKPEIKTQIQTVFQIEGVPFSQQALDKFAEAIAKGVANVIIPHITSNSVVLTSVAGVQVGPTTLANQQGIIT